MEVAEKLYKEEKISAVYSSDLLRASKTAERIADKCGVQEVRNHIQFCILEHLQFCILIIDNVT